MEETLETFETSGPKISAGEMVRQGREAAGMSREKLGSTLRISAAALEAIETCNYNQLPGDPYVRALLVSLARHLGLDSKKLLLAYNADIGNKSAEETVSPYKDTSHVHILAHRKLFIGLLAVLLIGLLVILAKVNSSSSSEKNEAAEPSAPHADSVTVAPPPDTVPVSAALQPDSLKSDSAKAAVKIDSAKAAATKSAVAQPVKTEIKVDPRIKADSLAKVAAKLKADSAKKVAAKPDTAKAQPGSNRVSVKPLIDSVWMRVLRHGKPEEVILLRTSKPPVEVAHTDTIVLILGKRNSVEITFNDTTLVPTRKRFKLSGKKIIYF